MINTFTSAWRHFDDFFSTICLSFFTRFLQICLYKEFAKQIEKNNKVEDLYAEEVAGLTVRQHSNGAMNNYNYELK